MRGSFVGVGFTAFVAVSLSACQSASHIDRLPAGSPERFLLSCGHAPLRMVLSNVRFRPRSTHDWTPSKSIYASVVCAKPPCIARESHPEEWKQFLDGRGEETQAFRADAVEFLGEKTPVSKTDRFVIGTMKTRTYSGADDAIQGPKADPGDRPITVRIDDRDFTLQEFLAATSGLLDFEVVDTNCPLTREQQQASCEYGNIPFDPSEEELRASWKEYFKSEQFKKEVETKRQAASGAETKKSAEEKKREAEQKKAAKTDRKTNRKLCLENAKTKDDREACRDDRDDGKGIGGHFSGLAHRVEKKQYLAGLSYIVEYRDAAGDSPEQPPKNRYTKNAYRLLKAMTRPACPKWKITRFALNAHNGEYPYSHFVEKDKSGKWHEHSTPQLRTSAFKYRAREIYENYASGAEMVLNLCYSYKPNLKPGVSESLGNIVRDFDPEENPIKSVVGVEGTCVNLSRRADSPSIPEWLGKIFGAEYTEGRSKWKNPTFYPKAGRKESSEKSTDGGKTSSKEN